LKENKRWKEKNSWGNRKEAKKERGSVKDEENVKYREITK